MESCCLCDIQITRHSLIAMALFHLFAIVLLILRGLSFRAFEKREHKLVKLGLDVKYLENCAALIFVQNF